MVQNFPFGEIQKYDNIWDPFLLKQDDKLTNTDVKYNISPVFRYQIIEVILYLCVLGFYLGQIATFCNILLIKIFIITFPV